MPRRTWYFISTALHVLVGGLWIGIFLALAVNDGKVSLSIALEYSGAAALVLSILSIKYHAVVRKICLPFLFLS